MMEIGNYNETSPIMYHGRPPPMIGDYPTLEIIMGPNKCYKSRCGPTLLFHSGPTYGNGSGSPCARNQGGGAAPMQRTYWGHN